jgi:3-hydroxyacyl-CoA dehydrogenase/enoyl-CoA hydratase/3-hydroxybutyryl-CoA epimerase
MTMMLTGSTLSARAAKRNGLIDQCSPQHLLLKHAIDLIKSEPKMRRLPVIQRILAHPLVRQITAYALRKQTAIKANIQHYPAPFELIRLWQNQPKQRQDYFTAEALSVAQLIQTQTTQNLVRLFLLQKRLKEFAKHSNFEAKHVHVIGAGVMGGDIAAWCALKGLNVTLEDQSPERIAPAIARAQKLFTNKLKQQYLIRAAMDRLQPDYQGQGVQRADVVIEAIYENLEAKQSLYKRIEPHLAEHAVLATNTSSIPLETLSTCLAQPERLVGMHFFNPVAKMQLVEVVSSANTGLACQQKVTRFTRQIGRLPLPVKSNPGFLVNRILMPYLLEAVVLVEEGIDPKEVDFVAKEFGMPMGPIELADTVGLDICLSVATMLAPEFGLNVPASLKDKVEQGYLGRKNGQGFYRYPEQKQLLKTRHDEVDHHLI